MENISTADQIAELKKQVELLTRVASKAKLAHFTPKESLGQSVLINLYREDELAEPKVITGWKLVRDYIRPSDKGVLEEQIMEVMFSDDIDKAELQGIRMKKGKLTAKLAKEITDEERTEIENEISDIEAQLQNTNTRSKKMNYEDFFKNIIKESVYISSTTTKKDGSVIFKIEYKGKSYDINAKFIN